MRALQARLLALLLVPLQYGGHEFQDLETLRVGTGHREELQHEIRHQPAVHHGPRRVAPHLAERLGEVLVENHRLVPQLADQQVLLLDFLLERTTPTRRLLCSSQLRLGIVELQLM